MTQETPASAETPPVLDPPAPSTVERAAPAASDEGAPPPVLQISPDVPRLGVPFGASKSIPGEGRPSFVFLVIVSIVALVSDIATKLWAEKNLDGYPGIVNVWENHVAFVLAKNRGGAWGLLQGTSENVRRPFFLLVSAAAIAFIVTLYRRLQPSQRALKWGLPLVLGGALGNVFDRIRYGHVIDFIDFHFAWRENDHRWFMPSTDPKWPLIEHHWPTFNVADVAICVGVALMAIDMFTSKKPKADISVPVIPPEDFVAAGASATAEQIPAEAAAADAAESPSAESPALEPEKAPETKPAD